MNAASQAEAGPANPGRERAAPGRRRRRLAAMVVGLAVLGSGTSLFLGRSTPADPAPPEPGAVLPLGPLTLNLADGRFLRLAFALQLTEHASAAAEDAGGVDGARALDLAVEQLSGRDVAGLTSPRGRADAKGDLRKAVSSAYAGEVIDVYFTQFVTQ